jgi:Ribbon-helix-helix domain
MKDTRLIALVEPSMMKSIVAASRKTKVSVAEIVRRALQEYLKKK